MKNKNFSQLISESLADYKKHLWLFLKLSFLIYFIPTVLIAAYQISYAQMNPGDITSINSLKLTGEFINFVLVMIVTFTIIKVLLVKRKKKELSVKEAIRHCRGHYLEGILLTIELVCLLALLYILLIIPGIIFSVYWAFAFFALITDDVGLFKALSHSKKVVEGRWWRVFGYLLAEAILIILVIVAILIPVLVIGAMIGIITSNTAVDLLIGYFFFPLVGMFITPFNLIFMEKFYLDLKKSTKGLKNK